MRLLLLVFVFLIAGCSVGYKKNQDNITWTTWNEGNGQVIVQLPHADPRSFAAIDDSYGKDNFHVYFEGKEIAHADPGTFHIIRWYFSKDTRAAYYQDKEIIGAKAGDIAPVGSGGYSKDSDNVFYQTLKVDGADKSTFEAKIFWGKDKMAVTFLGKKSECQPHGM